MRSEVAIHTTGVCDIVKGGQCTCPEALSGDMRSDGSGRRDRDADCSGVASVDGAKTCTAGGTGTGFSDASTHKHAV